MYNLVVLLQPQMETRMSSKMANEDTFLESWDAIAALRVLEKMTATWILIRDYRDRVPIAFSLPSIQHVF